jgi:diguanylate cyclase (GGDEF)-like protein
MTDAGKANAGSSPTILDAFNNLAFGIIIFDADRRLVFCNIRYQEIYGLSIEQVRPGTPIDNLNAYRLSLGLKIEAALDENLCEHISKPKQPYSTVQELSDGRTIRCSVQSTAGGGMEIHEDITEREQINRNLKSQYELVREQQEQLREKNFQFDTAINNMSQGLCFFDSEERLIVCNDRYLEMYGLKRSRVVPGTPLSEIVDLRFEAGSFPEMSRQEYLTWRSRIAISDKPSDSIVELRNGKTFLIRHRPMPDYGWVATHEDITEKRQAEQKIEHMAYHDSLTGLTNRALFNERLQQALERSDADGMVAVHHIDLDRFKAVNDTLGHHIGDRLLKFIAVRLRDLIGSSDTISRLGGDEFAIIQTQIAHRSEAATLAERVVAALSETVAIDGHHAAVGASPNDGCAADTLVRNADLALYRSKENGRAKFCFFEAGMDEHIKTRRAMEQDLRKAHKAGEFELYYQPVVNLQTGEISGLEALSRWTHPQRGQIPPATFIPIAEENGFIVPLGDWIIREACRTAARWPEHLHVAVNVSAAQFRSPALVKVILDALADSQLAPARLEIEITETILLHHKENALAILRQLHELGISIAMDDFGTGYSSLTYLQSFPFDKIKIDRSFVKDITDNAKSLNIVRAIVAMAKGMGMATTAEGVETSEQLNRIVAEGCTEMQGYFLSRPLPAADIARLFAPLKKACTVAGTTVTA